jgi:hypothetical protein
MKSWPASLIFNAVTLGVPLSVSFIAGPIAGAVFYLLWNVGTLANSFVAALTSLGLGENRRYSRREILKNIGLVALAAGVGGEVSRDAFANIVTSQNSEKWIAAESPAIPLPKMSTFGGSFAILVPCVKVNLGEEYHEIGENCDLFDGGDGAFGRGFGDHC